MRVETYYNLHKKCLSYRQAGGRVQYADTVLLNNVRFAVQPAGRQKTRTTGQKCVHAFVRGEPVFIRDIGDTDDGDLTVNNMERQGYRQITYNPHKYESFVFVDTGASVHAATQVAVIGKTIWLTGKEA